MNACFHEVTVRVGAVNGGSFIGAPLSFPLDMLRHDMLAPKTGEDVGRIIDSISGEEAECFCPKQPETWPTVKLVRLAQRSWSPTAARWESFGWEVIGHEVTKR